jgi:Flp pilus assembly protein TadD
MIPIHALVLAASLFGASSLARADVLADARRLAGAAQPQAALEVIDQALVSRPKDPELRFLRGVVLTDLGRQELAWTVFTELNQEFPELPDPLNNLAVLHAARGELDRARELLEAALRNLPRHRAARENLGDVYLQLAIRQWQAVASQARPEPDLVRKLELARQLAAATASRP